MKGTVFAFSIILPVLVGCRSSPQPTGTIPPSASTPSPTDTTIPQSPEWIVYNTANSGLPDDRVFALAIDPNGNKWIGTGDPHGLGGGGLVMFDGETWTVYDTANSGLPDDNIWALAIDVQDNKWIGTHGGGLAKFDGKNWTVYNNDNSRVTMQRGPSPGD